MLHRAEIVDLCNDEAARISDQSFSNFLIKYVFIEEKIIPFSTMIETCFQINQSRTIEACNILLNVFSDQGVREHDLQIIPDEAKVIRLVFDYYIRYGYGGRRIATELAAQGIYDRNGEVFHPSSINAFLHRELFTGVMCRGGVRSQLNPELQIISPETFQKAQQVMEKRKQGQLPKNLEGRALLSGNVYRSYCEGRIFASTVRKTHRVTEHNERIPVYKCYNRVQHRERCSAQSTYQAERIDKEVLRQLKSHVDTHPELKKLYDKAMEAEFSIRKMILCQWIERVDIFTYNHIEVLFQDEIEIF